MAFRPAVLALLALPLLACSGDTVAPCTVAADCASGVCLPDGTCAAPADAADTRNDDAAETSNPSDGDTLAAEVETDLADDGASPDVADTADGAETTPVTCLPNGDGRITRAEVPIAPDLHATFLVAEHVAFDSRGTPDGDPRWDLAQAFEGDMRVLVETLDPAPLWFGPSFPTATYATRLAGDLLGVFEARDDGLYLLGVVSSADGLLRTELAYDPPARILAYPLALDASWTTTSTVTGLTNGVVSLATETYEGRVDARGTLATPFADFDVLRAVVALDRWVGGALYFEVQQLFVSECFGTVASLRSEAYEAGPELTTAAELRRLSP